MKRLMRNNSHQFFSRHSFVRGRFNYAMMFFLAALIATLLPAFLIWGWGFWYSFDSVRVNTILGIFISCMIAGFSLDRFMIYPGSQVLPYMIKTVTTIYLLLFAILLITRFEYSRSVILCSYLLVLILCWLICLLGVMYGRRKYAIIPVGNYKSLCEIDGIDWYVVNDLTLFDYCYDAVVADLNTLELQDQWQRVLANCALLKTPIYDSKQIYESLTGRVSLDFLHQSNLGAITPSLYYLYIKMVVDMVAIIVALPLLLPLMLATAALIKIDSPGPIFFLQKRVGQGNKDFIIYKFRSMHVNAELGGAKFAEERDCRTTRVGALIRRYRIDELPQFFNVLKGDMSLIGPRPEQRVFVEKFQHELPFYMYRHMVRPGISGWAQVMYGYSADIDSTRKKVEYDLYYIKNFSVWLDVLIVFKTIKTMATGFGAR